ncbi:hypothetical protein [Ignatzschineria larvae]|uniref:hypothetical protein n=1 Tax=Ignatzschineria larvae TaxID=112009 RepID=UPI00042828F8|nr:hypothetical protein [Ignatzschineria larvae]
MKKKILTPTIITLLALVIAGCASSSPSMHYRNDYSNQVYGRLSFGYNLGN